MIDNLSSRLARHWCAAGRALRAARRPRQLGPDMAVLENRTLYSATPLGGDPLLLEVQEDAASSAVDLHEAFGTVPASEGLQFEVAANSNPQLFDQLRIDDAGMLHLDWAADQHGEAQLVIVATDAQQQQHSLELLAEVESVNDLPTISQLANQVTHEDMPLAPLQFTIGDVETAAEELVVTVRSSNQGLVSLDNIVISGTGAERILQITPNADAHGQSEITVDLFDGQDHVTESFQLEVQAVNDAPTTGGLDALTVTVGTEQTVIDLFAAFDDVEDEDGQLTFSVITDANPDLFQAVELDQQAGTLTLRYAPGAVGTASLTVVATDTGGLSAGWGTADSFAVYDQIYGEVGVSKPDTAALGLQPLKLWTHWFFFDRVDGEYQFDHLAEDKFRRYLNDSRTTQDLGPIVFDIENDFYDNSPAGRERFGQVLQIAHDERPDLEFGIYRIIPERSWHFPIHWHRAQRDAALGIHSYYTHNYEQFQQEYLDWHQRNSLYRTAEVSEAAGGGTVADKLDMLNPSLYTFYRNRIIEPVWRTLELDSRTDTLRTPEISFADVSKVKLAVATDARLDNGLETGKEYFVVNATAEGFQLAERADGPPIDFDDDFRGRIYIGAIGPWDNPLHDPNVVDWKVYAEENIAEARKFDGPVYAWISPSIAAVGQEHLDYDFFRLQLDILRPLVDGIVIYEAPTNTAEYHVQQGWWGALNNFMQTLEDPAATLQVTVTAEPNRAPIGGADRVDATAGQPLVLAPNALLANDSDEDGQAVRIHSIEPAAQGAARLLEDGRIEYLADASFSGIDLFRYRLTDGTAVSEPVEVSVHVGAPNRAPQAQSDLLLTAEDESLLFRGDQLLSNDLDPEETTLQLVQVTQPEHGQLTRLADGSYRYQPHANFFGIDTFTYQVRDEAGLVATGSVQIRVTTVNDAPVSRDDTLVAIEDHAVRIAPGQLLSNDTDPDGDGLSIQLLSLPEHGTLQAVAGGGFRYLPHANFHGQDQFRYRASDGALNSQPSVVRIQVQPTNDVPVATADWMTTREDTPLVIQPSWLLENDHDLDGDQLQLELVTNPAHGQLVRNGNGQLVYTPGANFSGADFFTYRATDGQAVSNPVRVKLEVTAVPDRPTAVNDHYQTRAGQTIHVGAEGVLANDTDHDGRTLVASLASEPRHGLLTLLNRGSFAYTPHRGFSGTDTFTYWATDTDGHRTIGTVTVQVQAWMPHKFLRPSLFDDPLPSSPRQDSSGDDDASAPPVPSNAEPDRPTTMPRPTQQEVRSAFSKPGSGNHGSGILQGLMRRSR